MGGSPVVATPIILRGRKVVGGVAEGEALVSQQPVEGWINADSQRGIITEIGHELRGVKLKGKVFVFPHPRGSGAWAASFGNMKRYHTNPIAMIFTRGNSLAFQGGLLMDVPTMTDLDQDPVAVIETGDLVKVDADRGVVEVIKRRA
jgi:predicted aconitase with swiveling domain